MNLRTEKTRDFACETGFFARIVRVSFPAILSLTFSLAVFSS